MTLRPIFAMLIAFAMLFAPFAMRSGGAMAASTGHHGQAAAPGHCDDRAGGKSAKAGMSCGVAMCVALAVEPAAQAEPLAFIKPIYRPAPAGAGPSFLVKLPTPPPRLA
ncbi:MAG TPA: hypothetical protein VNI79_04080 [Sphingomicrobium sp.]|nr:hypothetical protein [Sphingomicrobium sp.]